MKTKKLLKKSNKLFEYFSAILKDDEIEKLNQLLEIERELTLLEGQ